MFLSEPSIEEHRMPEDGANLLIGLLVDAGIWALYAPNQLPPRQGMLTSTSVETNISIVAACIPTMRPLFRSTVNVITKSKKRHQQVNKGYEMHHDLKPSTKLAMPSFLTLEGDSSYEMGRLPRHVLPCRKADLEDDASSERNLVNDTELSRITTTTRFEVIGGERST